MKRQTNSHSQLNTSDMKSRLHCLAQDVRPLWLPDGYSDTLNYISLCLNYGARDAIGDALPDPKTPLADLEPKRFFRGKRMTWIFNVLCDQLEAERRNTFNGSYRTAEILSTFLWFMDNHAEHYIIKRHKNSAQLNDAIKSVHNCVKWETIMSDPNMKGSNGGKLQQPALTVTPDEFRKRISKMLELDANTTNNIGEADTPLRDGRKKKLRRPPSPERISKYKKLNELITEIRRRAKRSHSLGAIGIANAYESIEQESQFAGSKWRSIIGLAKESTIIDRALHNRPYKICQQATTRT